VSEWCDGRFGLSWKGLPSTGVFAPVILALTLVVGGCETLEEDESADSAPELLKSARTPVDLAALEAANAALRRATGPDVPIMVTPARPDSGVTSEINFLDHVPLTPVPVSIASGDSDSANYQSVEIEFINASLRSVIELLFDDYLKQPYTILPDIDDKPVNWIVSGEFHHREILRMFEVFLDAHGVHFIDRDGVFVVSAKPQSGTLAGSMIGRSTGMWKLRFLDGQEIVPVARQFLKSTEQMQIIDSTNTLIATASGSEIRSVDNFIASVDVPFFQGKSIIVYSPKFLSGQAVVSLLTNLPRKLGSRLNNEKKLLEAELVPEQERVVIVTGDPEMHSAVLQFLAEVDRLDKEQRQVFYYTLRNQDAQEVQRTLNAVTNSMFDRARISMIAHQATNSLLVTATPDEYFEIKKVIDRLDFTVPSVLIDATIVEVQLTDSLAYGVEWFLDARFADTVVDITTNLSNSVVTGGAIGEGATGGSTIGVLSLAGNEFATLDLLATETQLRVLSRPRVLVKNNGTATIKSTDQIRVVKTVITSDAQEGGSSLPQREFIDKEVGITLDVTPTISDDGTVELVLKIVDSRQGPNDFSSGESQPTFNVREISTNLYVDNGQTILIGGLIQQQKTKDQRKIPLLGDIPIIGKAFANQTDGSEKTELIVMVTPYVVFDRSAAKIVSDALATDSSALAPPAGGK
jgi:general secretion pathway protein D